MCSNIERYVFRVSLNEAHFLFRRKQMSSVGIYWIVVGVIAIISLIIHRLATGMVIDVSDFFNPAETFDFFIEDRGWVNLVIVGGLGGIVFAFVFWSWLYSLLILGGLILVCVIIFIIIVIVDNKNQKELENYEPEYEETKVKYKCPGCGANLYKIFNVDEGTAKFVCKYCDITYTKKDLVTKANEEKSTDEELWIDIGDFEEEYFNACDNFFFKPYNLHNKKEIERKYSRLMSRTEKCEDIYENVSWDETEDILQETRDFFIDNLDEIKEYFSKYGEEEIKRRYEFYCKVNEELDEESDDEE